MKFSIREFFLNEALGDPGSQSARGSKAKSSSRCQCGTKLGPGDKGVKGVRACGSCQDRAGIKLEYEDPTSSKDDGSSKWSSPLGHSDAAGMPHEVPQGEAQGNSSEAWEEMHSSSERAPGTHSKLKQFFGGEPHPAEEKDEAAENKPPEDDDAEFEKLYASLEDEPKKGEGEGKKDEDEIDWNSLDDEGFIDALAKADNVKVDPIPPKQEPPPREKPEDDSMDFEKMYEPFTGPVGSGPYKGPYESDVTWDELRAAHPEVAADLERELPGEELTGAKFHKRPDGRRYMSTTSGKVFTFLGPKIGWEEVGDGSTPDGEF